MKRRLHNNDREREQKPGFDSRGSSLIEVIVAMLLLAIIVVPMLNMFGNAARINQNAENEQYANTAMENVMEELRAGNYVFTEGVADPTNELRDAANRLRLYAEGAGSVGPDGMTYTTGTLQSGNNEYQARIHFQSEPYHSVTDSRLNDYPMPDIREYDADNSAVILVDGAQDSFAVSEFYREYLAQIQAEDDERYKEALENSDWYLYYFDFDAWYLKWQNAHPDGTEPPEDYKPEAFSPDDSVFVEPITEEKFSGYVNRGVKLSFDKQSETNQYEIVFTTTYRITASRTELRLVNELEPERKEISYRSNSERSYTANELRYLYLFYNPYSNTLDRESVTLDARLLSSEASCNCRVYLVVQGDSFSNALPVSMELADSLTAAEKQGRMKLLSSTTLMTSYPYTQELVPTLTPKASLYCVTVTLTKVGSDDIISEADTAIYYE